MEEMDKVVKRVFTTPDVEVVLSWLCKFSGLYESSYRGDPYASVYSDGMKAMVLKVLHCVEKDPEFMKEQISNYYKHSKRKKA